ncbi:Mechanosensitive ion channel-domain-containing protein, partial [Dichotomocladium elegans]
EQFDWSGADEADEDIANDKKDRSKNSKGIVLCLTRNSSYIAWSLVILFAMALIAITVILFFVYEDKPSMVSYSLQLWFTWAAFMWCISLVLQGIVELVPWLIKRIVGILRPHSTEVLRMRLAYYMALRPFIKLLLVSAWAWGSWAFIRNMIALPSGTSIPGYVNVLFSIWESVFFAALLIFIEKFILQLIGTFHSSHLFSQVKYNLRFGGVEANQIHFRKAYGDRIAENDRALRILDRLKRSRRRAAPQEFLSRIRRTHRGGARSSSGKPSRSNSADDVANDTQEPKTRSIMRPDEATSRGNVHFPTKNMDTLIAIPALESHLARRLRDVKKHARHPKRSPQSAGAVSSSASESPQPISRSTTLMSWGDDRSMKQSIPGKILRESYRKFRSSQKSSSLHIAQSTSSQAKELAKRIYHNLVGPGGNRSISEADFYPFFQNHQDAAKAFGLFDSDKNGDVSKRELRSTCVRIYRERKNLAHSMRDLSQATGKLDIILLIVFAIVWIIIVCVAFGVNVGTQLMPLWSAFIAVSFVFGNSAKDAFESIIFVFVTHPFDAGDRVLVGVENWQVLNVGLLFTTFKQWDGSIVYAKNSVLATQYIINIRRTGPTGETTEINVSYDTPNWKIYRLRDHMIEWANQYPALYSTNSVSANFLVVENQNRLTISFYFEHTKNWQDPGGRWLRHNNFVMELKEETERLGITYAMPMQPLNEYRNHDLPPEFNNMGEKSSYGLEGLRKRHGFLPQTEDDERHQS